VFAADFAILVAVAIVETCLAHGCSPLFPQPTPSSRGDQMTSNVVRCRGPLPLLHLHMGSMAATMELNTGVFRDGGRDVL
jgi:hypothetical protein